MAFSALTNDIFFSLLKYLSFEELIKFERTNKSWQEAVGSVLKGCKSFSNETSKSKPCHALDFCSQKDHICHQLPKSRRSLTSQELNLSERCPNLRRLCLERDEFGFAGSFRHLQHLSIEFINPESMAKIEELLKSTTLKCLEVSIPYCEESNTACFELANRLLEILKLCPALTSLRLRMGRAYSFTSSPEFSKVLQAMPLRNLTMNTHIEGVADSFRDLRTLRILRPIRNALARFEGKPHLVDVDIRTFGEFDHRQFKSLIKGICFQLKSFALYQIDDIGNEPILEILAELAPNLENLQLHFTSLLEHPDQVIAPVVRFKKLRTISVTCYTSILLLPALLKNCPKLREIRIRDFDRLGIQQSSLTSAAKQLVDYALVRPKRKITAAVTPTLELSNCPANLTITSSNSSSSFQISLIERGFNLME